MPARPHADRPQSHLQTVLGSLAAGMAAMTAVGVLGAFVAQGGLQTPTANAATPTDSAFAGAPTVRPIDVDQVQSQLNAISTAMDSTQGEMDEAMARLDQLAIR